MPINIEYEADYYAKRVADAAAIAAAIHRPDVREALARIPDANTVNAYADDGAVTLTAFVSLPEDPLIADIATLCDGEHFHVDERQELLNIPGAVRVLVSIAGKTKLSRDERSLLRAIGKLKTTRESRTYLACAA